MNKNLLTLKNLPKITNQLGKYQIGVYLKKKTKTIWLFDFLKIIYN